MSVHPPAQPSSSPRVDVCQRLPDRGLPPSEPRRRQASGLLGWAACLLLTAGCDGLVAKNPQSCIHFPAICDADSVCNPVLAICQPRILGVLGGSADSNDNLRYGLSGPLGVSLYESGGSTKLLVADTNNNRVLIWNSVPEANQPPDVVLGQPAFDTNVADYDTASASSMTTPQSAIVINGKLVVADSGNNRLMIWNSLPTRNYQPADLIWGQLNNVTSGANQGRGTGSPLSRGVSTPMVASAGSRLVVTDSVNNRVLIFNAVPTARDVDPDYLVGYDSYDENTVLPVAGDNFSRPTGGCGYARVGAQEYLAVPDLARSRVLGWDLGGLTPTDPKLPQIAPLATLVLGQGSFTGAKANAYTGVNYPAGLSAPAAAFGFGSRLWIADSTNDRVIAYGYSQIFPPPATPPALSPLPQVVLGQSPTATTYSGALDLSPPLPTSLDNPRSIAATRSYLAIADTRNNRILIWKGDPDAITSTQAPTLVLGQPLVAGTIPSFTSRLLNSRQKIDETSLNTPRSISGFGSLLVVADRENHRVLLWDLAPGAPTQITRARVLGQVDASSARPGKGATGTNHPSGVAVSSDGSMLAVADTDNHRVLIWDSLPMQTGVAASRVLGQLNFDATSVSRNQQRPASSLQGNELSGPTAVGFVQGSLLVSDTENHRILAWPSSAPSGSVASLVIGQPDMKAGVALQGAQGLSSPAEISADERFLYVADSGNHRVLGFPLPLAASSPSASLILGEYDYRDGARERASATSMNAPRGVLARGDLLLVADTLYNRTLIFRAPLREGQAAQAVFGQPNADVGLALPNNGGMKLSTLNQPTSLYANEDAIFIADSVNNRIVVLSRWL